MIIKANEGSERVAVGIGFTKMSFTPGMLVPVITQAAYARNTMLQLETMHRQLEVLKIVQIGLAFLIAMTAFYAFI